MLEYIPTHKLIDIQSLPFIDPQHYHRKSNANFIIIKYLGSIYTKSGTSIRVVGYKSLWVTIVEQPTNNNYVSSNRSNPLNRSPLNQVTTLLIYKARLLCSSSPQTENLPAFPINFEFHFTFFMETRYYNQMQLLFYGFCKPPCLLHKVSHLSI